MANDCRGYGHSAGTSTLAGIHRDTRAALVAADRTDDRPRNRLVLLGQSMGGATAVSTVAALPPEEWPGVLIVDSAPIPLAGARKSDLSLDPEFGLT